MLVTAGIVDVVVPVDPSDGGVFATAAVVGTRHIGARRVPRRSVDHKTKPVRGRAVMDSRNFLSGIVRTVHHAQEHLESTVLEPNARAQLIHPGELARAFKRHVIELYQAVVKVHRWNLRW